ncbi:MAG: MFS transporter [Steroidobacteraceae bacterium]|nr:MFS transporter [Steroidobacteraceae bacterium]
MAASRARLAAGFFWYFAALGLFVPYWPVYLDARGFDALQIGILMSVFAALRIVGAPAYAHWADTSGRPLALLRMAAASCLACALAFPWLESLVAVALVLALYSALWNGIVSVYDAHVLEALGAESGRYGSLRLWGSVGFIATSVAAGAALTGERLVAMPWLLAALIGCTWLALAGLGAGAGGGPRREAAPLGPALRDRRVLAFLLVSFLMLLSHGAYYSFLSLYLGQHGYSRLAIGLLWAWAVAAEIAVFLLGRQLLARFSLQGLVVAAVAATTLRWLLIAAFPGQLAVMLVAQAGHMASFGLFHLCAVEVARRLFPSGAAARAQALHSSIGFGLGGTVGALVAGWTWERFGPSMAFYVAAAAAALATLVAVLGLRGLPAERDGHPDFGKSRV